MNESLIESQLDLTNGLAGKILYIDQWGYHEVPIEQPILSYLVSVDATRGLEREDPSIDLLLDLGNGESSWLHFEAQQVWLVLDRKNNHGSSIAYFAS